MYLYNIFTNNFDIIIAEFFLSLVLLNSILYAVILIKASSYNNQKRYIIESFNNLFIFLMILTTFLMLNTSTTFESVFFNGVFIFDDLAKTVKLVLLFATLFFLMIQKVYTIDNKINTFEYLILIGISLLGLMFLSSSYNLILIYLSIELQSLSFYILAAYQRKSSFSSEAALKYFILGAIASGFILLGSSLIYISLGSINLSHMGLIFSNINEYCNIEHVIPSLYGIFLIFFGLLFKIGAAPFHFWIPDVYEGSSNNITAFFSIVPKISIITLLLRFFFDSCNDISFFFEYFFSICALLSIFVGSFITLKQKKIKRLLAYSSIGHVGFILIAFSSNSLISVQNILFYIIIYIIMTINFWVILLSLKVNGKNIKYITDFGNLSKINPIMALILTINLFSMAGIPPLAGFFTKFFVFYAALQSQLYTLSIIGILLSIISTVYYIRIIKIAYFDNLSKIQYFNTIPLTHSLILSFGIQLIIFFCLYPSIFLTYLEKISLLFFV